MVLDLYNINPRASRKSRDVQPILKSTLPSCPLVLEGTSRSLRVGSLKGGGRGEGRKSRKARWSEVFGRATLDRSQDRHPYPPGFSLYLRTNGTKRCKRSRWHGTPVQPPVANTERGRADAREGEKEVWIGLRTHT